MSRAITVKSRGLQLISFCLALSLAFPLWSQPAANVYAIKGAKVYTLAGPAIENGIVVIRDGKIAAVGANIAVPDDAQVINAAGLEVYPGMFDPITQIGLNEVGAVSATVDTREPARDKDLRSDHFFDVEHFPTMTFKSTKVEQVSAGKLKVTGNLTIRGVTKEVVLDVDGPTAPVKDPYGNQRAAVNATTKINRQDFGVKWNATMDNGGVVVGDEVNITIDAEMIKQVVK